MFFLQKFYGLFLDIILLLTGIKFLSKNYFYLIPFIIIYIFIIDRFISDNFLKNKKTVKLKKYWHNDQIYPEKY